MWTSALMIVVATFTVSSSARPLPGKHIFCYYSSFTHVRHGQGRFLPENINPHLCTHLVYAFADITPDGRNLKPLSRKELGPRGLYARTLALKEQNPSLKVLLAVGGWQMGSKPFIPMIREDDTRRTWIRNVVLYLRKYGFDGMDMDWEFPATRDSPPADKHRFTLLMKGLFEAFLEESIETGKEKLLLTLATASGSYYIDRSYEPDKIIKYIDYMLLMTYNYHGQWEKVTGHHSGVYRHRNDPTTGEKSQLFQEWSIDYWLNVGVPKDKLIVGIPSYGMSFTLADPSKNGVHARAIGGGRMGEYTRETGILAYYEICTNLRDETWTSVWIDDQAVPYAHGGDQWVGYEDQKSVVLKALNIISRDLAGAFVWSLELDDFRGVCGQGKFPLLTTIHEILGEKSHSHLASSHGSPRDAPKLKSRASEADRPKSEDIRLPGLTNSDSEAGTRHRWMRFGRKQLRLHTPRQVRVTSASRSTSSKPEMLVVGPEAEDVMINNLEHFGVPWWAQPKLREMRVREYWTLGSMLGTISARLITDRTTDIPEASPKSLSDLEIKEVNGLNSSQEIRLWSTSTEVPRSVEVDTSPGVTSSVTTEHTSQGKVASDKIAGQTTSSPQTERADKEASPKSLSDLEIKEVNGLNSSQETRLWSTSTEVPRSVEVDTSPGVTSLVTTEHTSQGKVASDKIAGQTTSSPQTERADKEASPESLSDLEIKEVNGLNSSQEIRLWSTSTEVPRSVEVDTSPGVTSLVTTEHTSQRKVASDKIVGQTTSSPQTERAVKEASPESLSDLEIKEVNGLNSSQETRLWSTSTEVPRSVEVDTSPGVTSLVTTEHTSQGKVASDKIAGQTTSSPQTERAVKATGSSVASLCRSLGVGTFPDPSSCQNFIVCMPGHWINYPPQVLACPHGTSFDPDLMICNYASRVLCSR